MKVFLRAVVNFYYSFQDTKSVVDIIKGDFSQFLLEFLSIIEIINRTVSSIFEFNRNKLKKKKTRKLENISGAVIVVWFSGHPNRIIKLSLLTISETNERSCPEIPDLSQNCFTLSR